MPLLRRDDRLQYWRLDGDPAKPKLVLLNSLGTDHALWDVVMPALMREFHILRMDKRGHGASTNVADQCSIADLGNDVLAVMDAAGWDRASVCGISIGGMTGMWLGAHAPSRIHRLVLSNTSAKVPSETFASRIAQVRQDGLAAIAGQILGRFFTADFIAQGSPAYHSVRQTLLQTDPTGYIACCTAIRDMELQNDLALITASSLVIIGEYDQSTSPAMGEDIVARIPSAQVVRLPLAHIPILEDPEGYARHIIGFLTS